MTADSVEALDGLAALQAALPNEPFLRAEVDGSRLGAAWRNNGATAWLVPSRRVAGRGHLVALGTPESAAHLLEHAVASGADIGSTSLPRDADAYLERWRLEPRNDWEWFWTAFPPPVVAHEEKAELLAPTDEPEVLELLQRASPRHDVKPGEPGVVRWMGIRAPDGRLVAVAAHAEHVARVPHLASITTDPGHRRQGLGAAITAALTRRCLDEGLTPVTLGMYSDNPGARRVYERLGFIRAHEFTSGRLRPH